VKRLIAISGPTASGKTELAIKLAQHFSTEILSVDSRQLYSEMPIGSAQPDAHQLAAVQHHFIASHSIHQGLSAAQYAKEARHTLNALFGRYDNVIAVGGSTLYFKALLEGLDDIPAVPDAARQQAQDVYEVHGLAGLQKEVEKADHEFYAKSDVNNHRRLLRALEVYYATGTPISFFHGQSAGVKLPYDEVVKIGLDLPRQELYSRIDFRCEKMLDEGLLDEVEGLYPYRDLRPLQTVGYSEFFEYIDGMLTYEQALEKFKQHTRNYAKRQMTWFKKDEEVRWFGAGDAEGILGFLV
jgi:tRNA dimethylallyltransferase